MSDMRHVLERLATGWQLRSTEGFRPEAFLQYRKIQGFERVHMRTLLALSRRGAIVGVEARYPFQDWKLADD